MQYIDHQLDQHAVFWSLARPACIMQIRLHVRTLKKSVIFSQLTRGHSTNLNGQRIPSGQLNIFSCPHSKIQVGRMIHLHKRSLFLYTERKAWRHQGEIPCWICSTVSSKQRESMKVRVKQWNKTAKGSNLRSYWRMGVWENQKYSRRELVK